VKAVEFDYDKEFVIMPKSWCTEGEMIELFLARKNAYAMKSGGARDDKGYLKSSITPTIKFDEHFVQ